MTRSRLAWRFVPALVVVILAAACSGPTKPAVDAKLLQQRLDQFVATVSRQQPDTPITVKAEGPSKVETKSDGTVIGTLPRMTLSSNDGGTAVIDPIQLRFSNGDEGRTNVEATFPSAVVFKDKTGKVEAEMKIGSQTAKGVWVESMQSFDDLDVRFSNISIKSPGNPGSAKIDEISTTGKITSTGGGLYDVKYEGAMKGFSFSNPAENGVMKIALISMQSSATRSRMEEYGKAAKEAGYTLADPNVFKGWGGEALSPKMIAFMRRWPEFFGGVDYLYAINGVEVVQGGKALYGLKKTSFGFGVSGDGAGTTRVKLGFNFGGASGSADEPLVPPEANIDDATIDIEATGIPGQQLWDIYMDALPKLQAEAVKVAGLAAETGRTAMLGADSAAKSGDTAALGGGDPAKGGGATTLDGGVAPKDGVAAKPAEQQLAEMGDELSQKAMAVMQAARIAIAFNKLNITTPTAKMTGRGSAVYQPSVAPVPVGKISLRFSGIDKLASAMEKRGPKDETAQQIMGTVTAIRAMGRADPASPKDDRAYIIDLELTKDGRMLANGQNLGGQ
jgi:hypothetical protein